jgi:pimeloyl-ACP methyl ester carboxylesterase
MKTVTSKDGTTIAYDQKGHGTPVILINGALGMRMDDDFVKPLAAHFTVINYDRRGRGDSTDTQPYDVQREVEDIEALISDAGGSAYLVGFSSGAVLALEAASKLPNKVKKLGMYEPPFIIDDSRPPAPADYVEQLEAAIAANDPGAAVEIFMTKALLIPPEFVAQMRTIPPSELFDLEMKSPDWIEMEKVAHTLSYDGRVMGGTMQGKPLPAGKWSAANMPTLVITGGNSEQFFHDGASALVDELPNAKHRVLEDQDHAVSPSALAPLLIEFFAG